ncbi:hypothetical protein [Singulisphaera sp. GP187]|uniref:hypothetical protein n=1 Tax=Singulisphaera sp. GP187 TaxID=1882752 RepID=UPI00094094E8|nr:hypothetical protein [Singulisphaera sp. GP187]
MNGRTLIDGVPASQLVGSDADWAKALQAHDESVAKVNATDQIGQLDALNADPDRLRALAVLKKIDPSVVDAMNGGNQEANLEPGVQDNLFDRVNRLAATPGVQDPNHPARADLQNWINAHYSNKNNNWNEDTYIPPDPNSFVAPSFLTRPAGLVAAMTQGLFDAAGTGHSAGTGFGWPQHFNDRTAQQGLLEQFGIKPPPGFEYSGY